MTINHIKTIVILISSGIITFLLIKKLDTNYTYTEKIRTYFKINKKWEGLAYYCVFLIPLALITIIGIWFIALPSNINSVLWGIALGLNTHIQNKNNYNKNQI